MSADSPRRSTRGVPAIVPPQVVSDRSIIDNVAGFINDVALTNQPQGDPKDTIAWARFEQSADISDPTFGDDWEIDGNISPPLLLILGYGLGVQVWAIPANGEAVEVLSWRHGSITILRVLPTPFSSDDEMADEPIDNYVDKRPLMAICDSSVTGSGSVQTCFSVNFVSLKTGAQVKTIKFKYAVLDVLANRTSVAITFPERIAVFDARTLEDRLSVTTCYPSPGINPNPVALGPRWMAYAENKILHSKRSGGGCDGDGVSSYTATVLNAAKSFGKGLRELGEQMAAGLTGSTSSGLSSKSGSFDSGSGDVKQAGVVTILDIKNPIKDVSPTTGAPISTNGSDPIIAHFIAHSEAVVAMEFDYSGMLLITADRRGHDFHVFRIQPHPAGSHLAAVHHLYILHRGDTSAKVQNITFALDSRWVAVSTLRGTTHVFPITPYGGSYGVRTHSSLHVVNKLSRFHRSAGLSVDNRSNSPISHSESMNFNQISMPYHNPTMPPFPRPHTILPLAQLRQPSVLSSPPGSAQNFSYQKSLVGGGGSNRQRLSSLSDDSGKPLSVCALFAKGRSWLLDPPNIAREGPAHKLQRKAVDSLFIMAGHGALIQYDLDTKLASNVAKEKICDDTPIELEVEAKAQWNLGRRDNVLEIQPPLSSDNWLVKDRNSSYGFDTQFDDCDDRSERWLSQVEIITHAGPHRRLWMGPQFVFKTYNTPSGSSLSHIDSEAIEIGIGANSNKPGRSSPMNMPLVNSGRSTVPVLIESGSYSSIEQSPKLLDRFRHDHMESDFTLTQGESRLKEDLADAMRESPSVHHKDAGLTPIQTTTTTSTTASTNNVATSRKLSRDNNYNTGSQTSPSSMSYMSSTYDGKNATNFITTNTTTSTTQLRKLSSKTSNLSSSMNSSSSLVIREEEEEDQDHNEKQEHENESTCVSIQKIVNPLGIVTTITRSSSDIDIDKTTVYDPADHIILENCDESLFRPVVAIFCDDKTRNKIKKISKKNDINYYDNDDDVDNNLNINNYSYFHNSNNNKILTQNNTNNIMEDSDYFKKPPELISSNLVVPVIEKSIRIDPIKDNKIKHFKTNENIEKYKINIGKSDKNYFQSDKNDDENDEKNRKSSEVIRKQNESYNINENTGAVSKNKSKKLIEITEIRKNTNSKKENNDSDENMNSKLATKPLNKKTKIEFQRENENQKKTKEMYKNKDIDIKNCDNINTKQIEYEKKEYKKFEEKLEDEIFIDSQKSESNITTTSTTTASTLLKNVEKSILQQQSQRKASKDEDSESFESLENIDEYDKQRKISDNFDSAEDCHHDGDTKWMDDDITPLTVITKYDDDALKTAKMKTDEIMNKSSTNSIEVTIKLPLKKDLKKTQQKTNVDETQLISTKAKKNNTGLEFFEKFSQGDVENEIENTKKFTDSDDSVQIVNIDFKTLQASLHEDDDNQQRIKSSSDLSIKCLNTVCKSDKPTGDKTKLNKNLNKSKDDNSTKSWIDNKISNINDDKQLLTTGNNQKKKSKKLPLDESIKFNSIIGKGNIEEKELKEPTRDGKTSKSSTNKITNNSKFLKNELEFPGLPTFESLSSDFKDTFLPPLSPLEPFAMKFDKFEVEPIKNSNSNDLTNDSLINFESPDSPKNALKNLNPITSFEPKPRGFTQETLIFALCGSLHYENENEQKMITSTDLIDNKSSSKIELEQLHIKSSNSETFEKDASNIVKVQNLSIQKENETKDSFILQSKRQNRKKEQAAVKSTNLKADKQLTTAVVSTAIISSSTSSSEETEESSSSIACNKGQKSILEDDEELRPLIDVSMTKSISCGTGSSLNELTSVCQTKPSSIKKSIKKPKTMSQILKGEINDDDNEDGDVDDIYEDIEKTNESNKLEQKNNDNSVTTITLSLPKSKKTLAKTTASATSITASTTRKISTKTTTTLPHTLTSFDSNNQSDSSTNESEQMKTSEEQASSESSDEQLTMSKAAIQKNKKLSITTTNTTATTNNIVTAIATTTTTSTISPEISGSNDDSSDQSETKLGIRNNDRSNISENSGNCGIGGGSSYYANNKNNNSNMNNNNSINSNLNNSNSNNTNQTDCADSSDFSSTFIGGIGDDRSCNVAIKSGGGSQSATTNIDTTEEVMSSSSVSSASRVSFDPPSSSPPNSGEIFLHFPEDSSGSL